MNNLLPGWPLFSAFVIASVVLAVTPGPGVIYIVTHSMAHGRRAGLASMVGVALGNFSNAIGASLGLALLFAFSSFAFTIVKYVGAAYLIYLGIQALRTRADSTPKSAGKNSSQRVIRDGFIVALFNPKTTLFFAAFLPQFMSPNASSMQSIALGSAFVAIAAISDSIYAFAAGWVGPTLAKANAMRNVGRYLSGGALIGLGLLAAFSTSNSSRSAK